MQHHQESNNSNSPYYSHESTSPSSIHSDIDAYSPYSSSSSSSGSTQSPGSYHHYYMGSGQQEEPSPPHKPQHPSTDRQLQRLFDQTLSNAKYDEISEFLHRYSELIDINAYDEEGQTPLQRFCQSGTLPLVKLLIQYGANPGMTNREGWSPVHIASFSGNTELYSYIVRCNSNSSSIKR